MTYAYCLAEAEDSHTAEYAVDEICYTSFEGTPSLEPLRAVRFVYGTKDAAAVRTGDSGGMALPAGPRISRLLFLQLSASDVIERTVTLRRQEVTVMPSKKVSESR
ncbi:hypothetical protein WMF45_10620 [Sorangium sp. So ce448]|uniref:hypothetical protein n=1 Tax=Sorangium sp. So ce426 TaxID=3133312 RepID=UPI003F5B4010